MLNSGEEAPSLVIRGSARATRPGIRENPHPPPSFLEERRREWSGLTRAESTTASWVSPGGTCYACRTATLAMTEEASFHARWPTREAIGCRVDSHLVGSAGGRTENARGPGEPGLLGIGVAGATKLRGAGLCCGPLRAAGRS